MPQPFPPVPPDRSQYLSSERPPARFQDEPGPIRKLLMGLPVILVATGFGAIVWLAYVEGQSSALGDPPLVRAIPEPVKVAPDAVVASNDDTVEDLLDEGGGRPPETVLQPPPEEPILTDPEPGPADLPAAPAAAEDEPAGGDDTETVARPADSAEGPGPAASLEPSAPPEASEAPAPAEPERAAPPPQIAAPRPAPERPTPPGREVGSSPAQPAVERRRPAPTSDPATRTARVTPIPAGPSGPRISPSGVEQTPAGTSAGRDRLRLEPPPPVLARAPSPTETPSAAGSPPIVAAPDDDGRSARPPTYRIQLASVREEADARRAWDLYRLEIGDVLADFEPVIERAEIANGTFYRVQAGSFGDRLEAEAICEELRARDTACLVVRR